MSAEKGWIGEPQTSREYYPGEEYKHYGMAGCPLPSSYYRAHNTRDRRAVEERRRRSERTPEFPEEAS